MKVKELIAALQVLPQDIDVVIGSQPIYFVDHLPGYYDGGYWQLLIDETKKPHYCIKGMRYTRAGEKAKLMTYGIDDYYLDQGKTSYVEIDPNAGEGDVHRVRARCEELEKEAKEGGWWDNP